MLRRLLMLSVLAVILAVVGFAPALAQQDGDGGGGDDTSQSDDDSGDDESGDDDGGGIDIPELPDLPDVLPGDGDDDDDDGFTDNGGAAKDQYGDDDDDDDDDDDGGGRRNRNRGDDDDDDDDDSSGPVTGWATCYTPAPGAAPICFPCPSPFAGVPLTAPTSHPLCANAFQVAMPAEVASRFALRNLGRGGAATIGSDGRVMPIGDVALTRAVRTAQAHSSPALAVRTASTAGLPFTGVNVLLLVLLGAMLIGAGMALRAADRLKTGWENRR